MARTDGVWEIIAGAIRPIGENGYDVLAYGTNRYLNFNTLYGTSGYGFRDNAGVMEYKNSGGSWAAFSGGGGGSGDVTGPASSTDGVPALFDGVTGKVLKNSTPTGTGNPVLQTSPTLTTPRFVDNGFIADSNGNEMVSFNENTSAVNYLEIENGATGNPPHLRAKGDDTNIGLHLVGKGTGEVSVCDATDETKRLRFGISNNGTGIITTLRSNSTGSSKTIDLPNASGTVALTSDLSSYQATSQKVTSLSSPNDDDYPTTQAVSTAINNAVTGLLDYRGTYDASTNLFPSTGGSGLLGVVAKGDFWIASVPGTLGGTPVTNGDLIISLIDTPGQTASNWDLISNEIGYTPENVANKSTSTSLGTSDTLYPSQNAAKVYVDTGLGTKQPLDADLTTIAGLTATTDNFMQAKAGAWASRTIAQVKTDLGLTGTNSGDVTLAGTPDYITIAGQVITRALINLTSHVTGTLPVANGGTGVASSTGTGSTVLSTSPTLTTPVLGTPTSGNLSTCTADGTDEVGFRNIPQNSQSAAYTAVLADKGKHIYHPSADTSARTWTIPANASVAYPIGTALTFVNDTSAGVITIAITTDTMVLAGAGTTGSRTLAANGIATAIKITSTRWIISGTNLT